VTIETKNSPDTPKGSRADSVKLACLPKKMFEKHGGFRTDLRPAPGSEIRNEDTEFGNRVLEAGERLRYEPSAVVYHEVPENRLREEYFLRWRFDYGRAQIRVKAKRPDVWGIPRHYISISNRLFHILPKESARWILTSDPKERFFNKGSVYQTIGEVVELYRRGSEPKETSAGSVVLPSKTRPLLHSSRVRIFRKSRQFGPQVMVPGDPPLA